MNDELNSIKKQLIASLAKNGKLCIKTEFYISLNVACASISTHFVKMDY